MQDDAGHWLTYAEAGERLRIDVESVKRRAQRAGWPRRIGNDKRALVLVPGEALAQAELLAAAVPEPDPIAELIQRALDRAVAAEARAAAAEARVELLERERRRLIRGLPTWRTVKVKRAAG